MLQTQDRVQPRPTARQKARTKIVHFPDKMMASKALKILDELHRALDHADVGLLPPIRAFTPEDGSLLIEWTSTHWRIGFSIERDDRESGWYLVSDESQGNVRAYGDLGHVDVQWLVTWALAHLR